MDFKPDTLSLKCKGEPVTVYIELPRGYNVNDIDVSSIKLNEIVSANPHPIKVGDYDDGIPNLMVKFDRDKVQRTLTPGPIPGNRTITIMGSISRAVPDFLGSDKIKVIDD